VSGEAKDVPAEVSTHQVLGRPVTMPVEIRTATAFTAMFSVPVAQTQRMIDYSGLGVLQHLPHRAVVGLVYVRYVDGDLGPYDEFGVAVLVRHHDDPQPVSVPRSLRALVRGHAGVLIHRLSVNGRFTMAAGRGIWGFPKELGEFETDVSKRRQRVVLRQDDRLAVDLSVQRGLPLPRSRSGVAMRVYSHLDGSTRCTEWEMNPEAVRARPGGARLCLGDHHISWELAQLGLPKRALFSTSIGNVRMTFADAEPIASPGPTPPDRPSAPSRTRR
jgi:hypothetical protein